MTHKTFISYKFSDVMLDRYGRHDKNNLRDRIIRSMDEDAKYHNGGDGILARSRLGQRQRHKKLSQVHDIQDQRHDSLMSPNMLMSDWMEWGLSYSFRKESRSDATSLTNGLVAVVQRRIPTYMGDGYSWFRNYDGSWDLGRTFELVRENIGNRKPGVPGSLPEDYVEIVTEGASIIMYPGRYIECANMKKDNERWYEIRKQL